MGKKRFRRMLSACVVLLSIAVVSCGVSPFATPAPTPTFYWLNDDSTPFVLPTLLPDSTAVADSARGTPAVASTYVPLPRFDNTVVAVNDVPRTTPCDSGGTIITGVFPSGVRFATRAYAAYLPPCYGSDGRAYPVMYLLHGSVQNQFHWLNLGLANVLDAGITAGALPPVIVVMPDSGDLGNATSGGDYSMEAVIVNALVPWVDSNFCSVASAWGRSIGGISRGGYWALETAFMHPGLFGSVGGHSSHIDLNLDPAPYNPMVSYSNIAGTGVRIWLDWGTDDFLRDGQQALHETLTAAGVAHEATVNSGGHDGGYWVTHLGEYIYWYAAAWPRDRTQYPACQP